jgi:hypothetical protein
MGEKLGITPILEETPLVATAFNQSLWFTLFRQILTYIKDFPWKI